ncbi:MAG: glycine cleavage system protein GcvH [Candidatus Methanomethylicia archaeon]|nr:glycine cleavage system protein GcvH [Candidatus Methanomethylicia archaeon]
MSKAFPIVKEGLYYSKDHEWVKVGNGKVIIGISDYAQNELRDIVYVELPPIGKKVKQFERLCSIESVKAVSDIYSPVSGEVIEVNRKLESSPELLNKDPYGEGWIAVIKAEKLDEELKNLMDDRKYVEYIKTLKTH